MGLDDLGLAAALEHCVNEWRSRLPSTTIDLSISGDFEALGEFRGLVLFRLVQEALTNIARHSNASRVEIRIEPGPPSNAVQSIEVLVADNGGGADMSIPRTGLGLVGMRERVSALGGSITLASGRGSGFKVMASLPLVRDAQTTGHAGDDCI